MKCLFVAFSQESFDVSFCFVQLEPGKAAIMAQNGNLRGLQAFSKFYPKALTEADPFGFTPFHEAIRSGNLETVKFLLDRGADLNLLSDSGISPLWIARHVLGPTHEVSQYLEELGAIVSTPQTQKEKGGDAIDDDDDDKEL
jgi:hypothetical protein